MPHAPLARLMKASNCTSQLELAELLSVHPSAIAAGKKRGKLPPNWLITVLKKKGINPDWVLTGRGPRFLVPGPEESVDAAWDYSLPIVLTSPTKVLAHLHIRELLGEAYRRCIMSPDSRRDISAG